MTTQSAFTSTERVAMVFLLIGLTFVSAGIVIFPFIEVGIASLVTSVAIASFGIMMTVVAVVLLYKRQQDVVVRRVVYATCVYLLAMAGFMFWEVSQWNSELPVYAMTLGLVTAIPLFLFLYGWLPRRMRIEPPGHRK